MKKKLFRIAFLAAVVFLITTCDDPADEGESPYIGNKTITVTNEQVWEHTESQQESKMYEKSTVTADVSIIFKLNNANAGSGEIKNGILSFSAAKPESENLLGWDYLSKLFPEWKDVSIDDSNTKGNVIIPTFYIDTTLHRLLREKLANTKTSFGLEEINHVYVDRDCKITGTHNEGVIIPGSPNNYYYITEKDLNLSLKAGWNLLCRKEVYASEEELEGRDAISMEIKNLVDFRWAIW